jgi:hypothetical protein
MRVNKIVVVHFTDGATRIEVNVREIETMPNGVALYTGDWSFPTILEYVDRLEVVSE